MVTVAERKSKTNNSQAKKTTGLSRHLNISPQGLFLAKSSKDLLKIKAFKKSYCQDDRPGVSAFHDDGFDAQSHVLFGTDTEQNITSTARLLLDSEKGFPEEKILPESISQLRADGKKLAELGRLVILDDKVSLLRLYYKAVYEIAVLEGVDVVLIVMKKKNVSSHTKIMAVNILSEDMGVSWDEEEAELCLLAWDIKSAQPLFHRWIGRSTEKKPSKFLKKEWDHYSPFHLGVLTSVQHKVYQHVPTKMRGKVLDLGCGSGRIMGYLQTNSDISSYTGVDSSMEMIKQARWLKAQLGFNAAELVHSKIEDIEGKYDSILSIHSYYSWSDQASALSHIHKLLSPEGIFVLVTPNDHFDVEKLSQMVKQELLGHPYYEEFLSINYSIAKKATYGSMDELIGQVRQAGFIVNAAHSDFFLGGASYLELRTQV